jgi:hypothetical protein
VSHEEKVKEDLATLYRRRAELMQRADHLRERREKLLGAELLHRSDPDAKALRALRDEEVELRDKISAAEYLINKLKAGMLKAVEADAAELRAAKVEVWKQLTALCEKQFPRLEEIVTELVREFGASVHYHTNERGRSTPKVAVVLPPEVCKDTALILLARKVQEEPAPKGSMRALQWEHSISQFVSSTPLEWRAKEAVESAERRAICFPSAAAAESAEG